MDVALKVLSPGDGRHQANNKGSEMHSLSSLAQPWLVLLAGAMSLACVSCGPAYPPGTKAVIFTGGHETDPRDKGRPVILIAAALGVEPEVFREAFSGVTPAGDRKPTQEEAKKNKSALMKVLGPLGVTDERLDEVSDYYRYQPQRGDLWRHTPAQAHAVLEDGKIKRIMVTEPGSGYTTTPTAMVEGMDQVKLNVAVEFSKDMSKNGSVRSVAVE
jgi:hypothetical protein